jgi:hypothetical protein
MSQFGLVLLQAGELSLIAMLPALWAFLWLDKQSVHFVANCHCGRSVTVDLIFSGHSVRVKMSPGRSVGGLSVKVPCCGSGYWLPSEGLCSS